MNDESPIAWQPVYSSNIKAIAHDATANACFVQFISGGTWRYAGVNAELFNEFASAESQGKFFQRTIKGLGGTKIA